MFYSQCLLSKKGPLGTVWIAAHCQKRLKKDQVKQTDIPSSVDTMLNIEFPVVACRILAYLLLGVVRIFSKKVDFLFHDCRRVQNELHHFASSKRANESVEAMRTSYHSITLPRRFELDAFDLEVFVDQNVSSCNVKAREEIMLADTSKQGVEHSNDKYNFRGDISFEDYSSTCTPVRDVFSPHFMDIDLDVTPSRVFDDWEASLDKLQRSRFSLGECLEPMISGAYMPPNEGHQNDGKGIKDPDTGEPAELVTLLDKEQNMEKLRGIRFPLEESLEPPTFGGAGKQCILDIQFDEYQTDGQQIKHLDSGISFKEPEKLVRSFDKEQSVEAEEMRLPGITSLAKQITAKRPMIITIDATLDSKSPGATSPEFMAVRTPATKERAKVLKKRKCVLDESSVLPNNVVKQWIDYSTDLVCRRRKAPHTAFNAWKAHKLSKLPQSFLEPLIPCNSVALRSLVSEKKLTTMELVETAEIHVDLVVAKNPVNRVVAESPVTERTQEQTSVAPATPVTHSTSFRLHEVRGVSKPYILEPATSSESIERQLNPNEVQELDISLMDEELNSCAGDTPANSRCSVRARKVARYLFKNFEDQRKQKGEVLVNLLQVLKGKTRKESARLFYEILVLKTRDSIDVRQENAYGNILVLETPKLKDAF